MIWRILSCISIISCEAIHFEWYWLTFFTHWGLIVCAITFLLMSVHELRLRFDTNYYENLWKEGSSLFSLWKCAFVCFEITTTIQILIVTLYWSFLYGRDDFTSKDP